MNKPINQFYLINQQINQSVFINQSTNQQINQSVLFNQSTNQQINQLDNQSVLINANKSQHLLSAGRSSYPRHVQSFWARGEEAENVSTLIQNVRPLCVKHQVRKA